MYSSSVRFVTVAVSPCRYDPRTGEFVYYDWLEVAATFERIAIEGPASADFAQR